MEDSVVVKCEPTHPSATEDDSNFPSAGVKDEIFIEEYKIEQLVQCIKDEDEKMAKFNCQEQELLAKISDNFPILADTGHSLDIINKKKEAWMKIQAEFNSTSGKPAKDLAELKGLWKVIKLKTKADINDQQKDAGQTGGGPPKPPLGRPQQILSEMFGGQFDPLPDTINDAGPFQKGSGVEGNLRSERMMQMESSSCEAPSRSSKRKTSDQTLQEELLEIARIKHVGKMKILKKQERNEDLKYLLLLHECRMKNVELP